MKNNKTLEEKVLDELNVLGWPNVIETNNKNIETHNMGIDTNSKLEELLSKELSKSIDTYLIPEPIQYINDMNYKKSLSSRWGIH